jgi:beta-aspartyl-peptidase (threonine type)
MQGARHRRFVRHGILLAGLLLCGSATARTAPAEKPRFCIAVHGGAGSDMPAKARIYRRGIRRATRIGQRILERGGTSVDAVEAAVKYLEDHPYFNAGRGAVYNRAGKHELDASIMDGRTKGCGAVTGVSTVKNPIRLARKVMEQSRHVMFAGQGAEQFARLKGERAMKGSYFDTPLRRQELDRYLAKNPAPDRTRPSHGTVGAVALDQYGNLAAATSTGGLTGKLPGRVGDSPIVGAGTYADNATCAISCTGKGEQFIRHNIAANISAMMEYGGKSLEASVKTVMRDKLKPGDGGIIAVSRDGEIVLHQNTPRMFRGMADSTGRFEVKTWAD